MDSKTFMKEALRTNTPNYQGVSERMSGLSGLSDLVDTFSPENKRKADLLHCLIGISTEANEAFDAYKKHVFYGKELDKVNLLEEFGDLLWFMAIGLDSLDSSFEEIMQININKLRARYPQKFTEDLALNRDLLKERQVLENK